MPLRIDDAYSKERLKLVLDSTRLGMWDWNPQTNDVLFDKNWAEMLGITVDDLTMTLDDWSSRVHPDDMEKCFEDIQAHISGEKDFYENLHRMKHADGSWVYILDRGRVVERDEEGNAIRFTGTHADVTPLKKAEFESSLALKSRDRFFSAVSHELRAPIHAMLGLVDQVKKQLTDESLERSLSIVQDSGQHLLFLIKDILDASKLQGAALELQYSTFSLEGLIKRAVDLFNYRASEKGLRLNYSFQLEEKACLNTDHGRLYQALINLISNAIKYTERGTILVECMAKDSVVSLSVVDTGVGIENENDIFKPFFSVDTKSDIDDVHSTGLGLSITKEIIEALGFHLVIESTVNVGSRFSIEIPIEKMSADGVGEDGVDDVDQSVDTSQWNGKTILVVDDTPINISLVEMMLEDTPLHILTATNGKEALSLLRHHKVDVVLTDLHMPHMGGLQLSRNIREAHGASGIKIIIASADTKTEVWAECEEVGVDDYLEKPFDEDSLHRVIHQYIS